MSKILVCGLINIETTIKVDKFPVEYCPIDYNFFGIESHPSGVGLNLSLALNSLSDEVRLLSMVGTDSAGCVVRDVISKSGISDEFLCDTGSTAQSVVMYDSTGRRRIFCDLKDFQDKSYDEQVFRKAAADCDTLCLCNINFSRNLLSVAKSMGKRVACDVHTLSDINDEYNRDYMANSDILFLSNENIIGREEEFIRNLSDTYACEVIVIGMGAQGALMYDRSNDRVYHQKAVTTREIVNTVGAGDSLFSSFVHYYSKGCDACTSLKNAVVFASYKIGESSAAKGFLSEEELSDLVDKLDI